MTDSVSSNDASKYSLAAFFSGVGGIELGFHQLTSSEWCTPMNLIKMHK
ncbi:DNA modification methylase [Staphylococcus aureus]|nr:DNA modification methylase [Staphylococcus aureus]